MCVSPVPFGWPPLLSLRRSEALLTGFYASLVSHKLSSLAGGTVGHCSPYSSDCLPSTRFEISRISRFWWGITEYGNLGDLFLGTLCNTHLLHELFPRCFVAGARKTFVVVWVSTWGLRW